MDKICEKLEETEAELEKLKADYRSKAELCENLKRDHNEKITKLQEARSKLEKQTQELNEKEEEISSVKHMYEDVKCSLTDKETIIKHLRAANEKLRADFGEKCKNLEEQNKELVFALDEANEKNIDQEQKINVLKAEIEGLKGTLSISRNKYSDDEKRARGSKELKHRDNVVLTLEEDQRKLGDKLKWRNEQFKHLEEAHEKLRNEFKAAKEEWQREKSTLVDELCSLQSNLDSQIRISKELEKRLNLCNQALALEESRRKLLEVEVSEYKTRFNNVFADYEDTKSQLDCLTTRRDQEIASLRHTLSKKETFYKEMEYQAGKLEQENQELMMSLKELQEAHIHQAGGSSLAKLRNKLKSIEQMHRDSSAELRAKEAAWRSELETVMADLNNCKSELDLKDLAIGKLRMELEVCHSSMMQMRMENEESAVMLLVLKSGISDAQLKLTDAETQMGFCTKGSQETVSRLIKQLESKDAALAKAQKDINEKRERASSLLMRVESLDDIEQQLLVMREERDRYKVMLEEASKCQSRIKEEALSVESELKEKLGSACDALDRAVANLEEERERTASLSRKVDSFSHMEEQQHFVQNELEHYKELLAESSRSRVHLEEQALQMENQWKEKLKVASVALDRAVAVLEEERERTEFLSRKVESFSLMEEQQVFVQKELERYKELLVESSRSQVHLEEQAVQMENKWKEKLGVASVALDRAVADLAEERERAASLSRRVDSLNHTEEQQLLMQKELEQCKELLAESSRCKVQLEEQALQIESASKRKLEEVCSALNSANSELAEERKKATALSKRLELLDHTDKEKQLIQKELENHKQLLEDSFKCQIQLEEQALQKEIDANRKLKEVQNALDKVVSQLLAKTCEGHEIEFESWIWKSIAERLKGDLEESQSLRKELETCLLVQTQDVDMTKHEKNDLVCELEEKVGRISELQQHIVSLQQELRAKQSEAALSERIQTEESSLRLSEKNQMVVKLEKEVECLEQESFRREIEGAVFTKIWSEGTFEHERQNLSRLVEEKEQMINEHKNEKKNLVDDLIKLSSERVNILNFIGDLDVKIRDFSVEDIQLMGKLERVMSVIGSCESNKPLDELFNSKENTNYHPSPTSKNCGYTLERSPFRQLN